MSCACVCCLLVRTSMSRQSWHPLAPSFGRRASIHRSSGHPRSVGPSLGNAGRDLGRGFRAGGVVARRGEQGTRVRGLQLSSCFPPTPTPKRNGTGDLGRGGGGNFQGRRPRFLRLFARGCNRALELGEWRQATGMALLSTRVTTRSQSPSGSNRRPSWTLLYTHWKERVTHVTRGPSFPPSSC